MKLEDLAAFYAAEYANPDALFKEHESWFARFIVAPELTLHQLIHNQVCQDLGADAMVFDSEDWPGGA